MVVARLDLSGMEDVVRVLSGNARTVRLLDKVRAEVGNNPDDWLPVFMERAQRQEIEMKAEEDAARSA